MRKSSISGYTDAEIVELWEERAAVAEYDGGLSREKAEAQAANEIQRSLPDRKLPVRIWKAFVGSGA